MHGDIALFLLGILKLREVGDEKKAIVVTGPQAQQIAQIQPQPAQRTADTGQRIRAEEHEIAGLGLHARKQGIHLLGGKVFGQDRVQRPVGPDCDPGHTLGAIADRFCR